MSQTIGIQLNLLYQNHNHIDHGDVINSPGDIFRFIEQRFSITNIVANFYTPEQEKEFAFRCSGRESKQKKNFLN